MLNAQAMNRLLLLSCLVVGCVAPKSTENSSGAMAELRALDKQSDWRELLSRVRQVAPTQRDAEWEALVERAAIGVLEGTDVKSAGEAESRLRTMDELVKEYPSLGRSKTYFAKRAELGLHDLKLTFSNSRHSRGDDSWLPQVKEFVEKDTQTPGLAQRAAKELILGRLVAEVAFPLYQVAFKRDGDSVCHDAELPKVIVGVIQDGSWADEAKQVATERCWAQLKGPLLAELEKKERPYVKRVCPMISGKADAAELKGACN